VTDIRALRLSRGLTLIDLALLTDIPARTLAQIEYGLQRLDYESRQRLARVFEIRPELLHAGHSSTPPAPRRSTWLRRASPAVTVALAGALLLADPLLNQLPATVVGAQSEATAGPPERRLRASAWEPATPQPAVLLADPTAPPAATAEPPTATAAPPAPTQPLPPPPRFALAEDGPHGCPLAPAGGRAVLTQGYAVGTHAPAGTWGAVDLAVDSDGDGFAEPGASYGTPILAAHGGVARVYLGSWPGGNFVRVVNEQTGWSTAYGHLDTVAVADGELISDGAPIGTVGSTGMATGPHLHYEVWHGDANVDPTWLVEC
jgi:murein DD-endopeptidase MepM/ murein hydrolase activator NlpD